MSSTIEDNRSAIRKQWDSFTEFAYNPVDKTVMGRTGRSWAKILVFYFFYYGFLACLFAISITIVLNSLDENIPRYQTRLQTPGVAIQPKVPSDVQQTSNIDYKMDPESGPYKVYIKQMDDFLDPYYLSNQTDDKGFQNCDENQPPNLNIENNPDEQIKSCRFDRGLLGPCGISPYGFDVGKPCVLIKLNRIINWFPVGFTNLSVSQATGTKEESNAPALTKVLSDHGLSYKPYLMYTTCYAYEDDYQVKLDGGNLQNIKYYPESMGLPFAYYPYFGKNRQPQYLNPLVAVQFLNVTKGERLEVACKVYALNIQDSKDMGEGFFKFEMHIEE